MNIKKTAFASAAAAVSGALAGVAAKPLQIKIFVPYVRLKSF